MTNKTTGPVSVKPYRCESCSAESQESTNHWGEIYSPCSACSWKRPGQATRKACLEPVPEGYAIPAKWAIVTLDEAAAMIRSRKERRR